MSRKIFTIKELIDWNKMKTESQYEIDHQSILRDVNTCRLNDCEKELNALLTENKRLTDELIMADEKIMEYISKYGELS